MRATHIVRPTQSAYSVDDLLVPPLRASAPELGVSSATCALCGFFRASLRQVLLNEARAQVDVELDEGDVADATEAVDLPGLDDQDVAGAGFEVLPVDRPQPTAFAHELDLVVGMAVRSRTAAGEGAQEKHRHVDITLIGADELVRATDKRQRLLTNPVHLDPPRAIATPTSGRERMKRGSEV